jgi:hypothetical protein
MKANDSYIAKMDDAVFAVIYAINKIDEDMRVRIICRFLASSLPILLR